MRAPKAWRLNAIHFLAAAFLQTPAWASENLSFVVARRQLARSIATRLAELPLGDCQRAEQPVVAIASVPHHAFVPFDQIAHAYQERPIGRTIAWAGHVR